MMFLFGVLQIFGVLEVIPLGWHKEPIFWLGAIFWSIVGYYWIDITSWFHKTNWWLGFILLFIWGIIPLQPIEKTGPLAFLRQFGMWAGCSIVAASIRAFHEEYVLRKANIYLHET